MQGNLNLLLPLDFIVTGGFLKALGICLLICPGLPIFFELLFNSRLVPLNPFKYQFWAFFPGNPFLGLYIALTTASLGFAGPIGFWQSTTLQWVLLVGAAVICAGLFYLDKQSNYTIAQLLSVFKIWHNLLYFWYGYLAVAMTIVLLASTMSGWEKALRMIPGLFWLGCLLKDFFTPEEELKVKFQTAHTGTRPLWRTKRILRMRRTPDGLYYWD
jgi:hypothetical protein